MMSTTTFEHVLYMNIPNFRLSTTVELNMFYAMVIVAAQ